MSAYLKTIVAAVGALVLLVVAAASDKAISLDEANGIWLAVIAVATAAGVYAAPNRPPS